MTGLIVDSFGRVHTNLRVSVTDRCNIRCFYCMPMENVRFLPQKNILSFEEIARFVQVAADLGVNKIRLTGGEPLVRNELHKLVRMLVDIDGIHDVALTTNGMLLSEQAKSLRRAGLHRLNISLDTLRDEVFERISRRKGLDRILAGIDAAIDVGFRNIRLNAIAIAGLTEAEIVPLVNYARTKHLELRFIEFMPLDADRNWDSSQVISGAQIRTIVESEFGPILPVSRQDISQPATDYEFSCGGGRIGFIAPVTEPFCENCNRLRLTAEGKIRNCLFSTQEFDVMDLLRCGGSDGQIQGMILQCVAEKKRAHGIDSDEFQRPDRAMYQIGG